MQVSPSISLRILEASATSPGEALKRPQSQVICSPQQLFPLSTGMYAAFQFPISCADPSSAPTKPPSVSLLDQRGEPIPEYQFGPLDSPFRVRS